MPAPGLTARGLTFGAGPSNSTRDRPCASWPVTTRRIGWSSLALRSTSALGAEVRAADPRLSRGQRVDGALRELTPRVATPYRSVTSELPPSGGHGKRVLSDRVGEVATELADPHAGVVTVEVAAAVDDTEQLQLGQGAERPGPVLTGRRAKKPLRDLARGSPPVTVLEGQRLGAVFRREHGPHRQVLREHPVEERVDLQRTPVEVERPRIRFSRRRLLLVGEEEVADSFLASRARAESFGSLSWREVRRVAPLPQIAPDGAVDAFHVRLLVDAQALLGLVELHLDPLAGLAVPERLDLLLEVPGHDGVGHDARPVVRGRGIGTQALPHRVEHPARIVAAEQAA